MEETLHVAIVGVGWAGTRHVEAIGELDRKVDVACLVDPDTEHLAAEAARFGIQRTYSGLSEALADPLVGAVSICSPHAWHCPQAIEAAQAGKHVLCEKPMAMDVEEATRMIDACEANGVRLYVAESAVYTGMSRTLREIVQTGRYIGELTAASVTRGFRGTRYGYPGRRAWLADPRRGGTGTWMLHGIHTVAQVRFVLGEVASLYMQEHSASSFERRDIEGTVTAQLTLENGVQVSVLQTPETKLYGDLGGYVLHGDAGSIRAWEAGYQAFSKEHEGALMSYPAQGLSPFAQEIDAFADYVAKGIEGPTTGVSERRSLAVVQAGYESAETGKVVNLRERFSDL